MKRKSNFIGRFSLKAMVSRTTIFRICIWNILVIVCVSDSGNGENLNYQMKQVRTTPMVPNHGERVIRETIKHETILNDQFNNSNSNYKNSNNNNNNNNTLYVNQSSLSIGNELWDGIIHDCYRRPTISCFQKNVFTYLDKTLDVNDVNITNRIMLFKNQVDYTKYTKEINQPNIDDMDNEIPNESRSESPIEEVTDALYGKSVKFVMTHDIELKMPEIMFDGATFRISPRSIEGNGALVKLELIPKTEIESRETGRIFKKKIAKFLKNKLLLSFLALIIIIKLIKIKIFWLLPIVIGVGAAKKLILKFLLFLFPALSHLFKLCSYYHENYHQTKFHHHHHLINHQHTVVPQWFDHGEQHSAVLPNGPELIFTNPPKGNPAEYLHGGHHGGHHGGPPPHIGPIHNGPPSHGHYPPSGWENSGPGLGSEYIGDIHRNSQVDGVNFKPKLEDANEIHSWGLGTTPHSPVPSSHSYNVNPFRQESTSHINQQFQPSPIYVSAQKNSPPVAAQIAAQYDPNINQQLLTKDVQRTQAEVKEALRIQAEQRLIAQQQKILQQQPFVQDTQPITPKGYDPFYSPILEKIDKILLHFGFTDDLCKERLVCSMYKNPARFSPHSNFISAELSRDTNELQKPSETNPTVIRFYRLIQAARDGQDQRDCLQQYPQCSINTE